MALEGPSRRASALDIRVVSPDGRWLCVLEHVGEVRFGPPYFALWLTRELEHRPWWWLGRHAFFGEHCRFSADSRFLIAERWHAFPPDTPAVDLVAFDLVDATIRTVVPGIRDVAHVEPRFRSLLDADLVERAGERIADWPF